MPQLTTDPPPNYPPRTAYDWWRLFVFRYRMLTGTYASLGWERLLYGKVESLSALKAFFLFLSILIVAFSDVLILALFTWLIYALLRTVGIVG